MDEQKPQDLKIRTKQFALQLIRLYTSLPKATEAKVIGKRVLRSGTSVGAQYREAQRAKSDADFINKVEGSLQELDETAYWLELIKDSGIFSAEKTIPLLKETDELIAVLVAVVKKVKNKRISR